MHEKLFTIKEAAQFLGMAESELVRLSEEGKVPGYKIGGIFWRYDLRELAQVGREKKGGGGVLGEVRQSAAHTALPGMVHPPDPKKVPSSFPRSAVRRTERSGMRPVSASSRLLRSAGFVFQSNWRESVIDFLYLNDFYIIAFTIFCLMLWGIMLW